MKRNFRKFVSAATCFSLALISICKAQPCKSRIDTITRPRMWFDKHEGQNRITNFRLTKKPVLNSNSGVVQMGYVNLGNFLEMLSYFQTISGYRKLNIYIGMYSAEGQPNVPAGFGKQLTLFFSPADDNRRPLNPNLFYVIPPGKQFDAARLQEFQINADRKNELVNNYFSKMPLSTIDPLDLLNVCKTCTNRDATDTWMISYERDLLSELITEQEYCHRDVTNTINIDISKNFVAYFTAQNYSSRSMDNFRISIAFDFADSAFRPINLEDTYGFFQRGIIKPVDNGQLCPTYCP